MGFDVTSEGLRIVLDAQVPSVVGRYIRDDVDAFLAQPRAASPRRIPMTWV